MKELTTEQIAKMTPEALERYEKRLKKVRRNRHILAGVIIVLLVAGIGITMSMTVLFNIKTIKTAKTGNVYTEQEIISASGLDVGKNMLRTDFDAAAQRIEKMLPYVLDAQIKHTASGVVTITVTDDTAAVYFKTSGGYAVADSDGKVLEIMSREPENGKLIKLETAAQMKGVPGELIDFSDDKLSDTYEKLTEALKKAEMFEKITGIDLTKTANIKIEYQHRMRIKLGDIFDIEQKLAAAAKTIELEDKNDPMTIAEINAVNFKKIYVNPLSSLDEVPGSKPEKRINEDEEKEKEEKEEKKDSEEEEGETEESEEETDSDSEERNRDEENSEEEENERDYEEENDENGEENESSDENEE